MASLGTAYVNIKAKLDKLPTGLKKARTQVSAATDRMQKTINTLSFGHVGLAATAFSATFAMAMKSSIDAASDLEEVTSKFGVVFGDQVKQAEKWSDTLVDAYAMSTREAKQYLSSVQDLLVPMGMQSESAAVLSNEIVKLSADLGSFNNMPTARVMDDIQSALVGNYETMKKYGVVLTAARVSQEALNMGLAESKDQLTAADKAQAAYKLMVEGSTAAIGDMARTSDSYANQTKKLSANVEDLSVLLGNELIPYATDVVTAMNEWIKANEGLIQQDVKSYVNGISTSLSSIKSIYDSIPDSLTSAAGYGIVGGILFGSNAGKLIAVLVTINEGMKVLDAGLGDVVDTYNEMGMAIKNLWGAIKGGKGFRDDMPAEMGMGLGQTDAFKGVGSDITTDDKTKIDRLNKELSGGELAAFYEEQLNRETELANAQIEIEKEKEAQIAELKQSSIAAEWEAQNEALLRYIEFSNAEIAVEKEKEEAKAKLRKQINKDMLSNTAFFFAEMGKNSEAAFKVWQGIKVAETVASTASAAMKAWEMGMTAGGPWGGPALAAAYAASAIAYGAAQVSAIMSASPGGGGSPAGTTSISATPTTNADVSTGVSLDSYTAQEEKRGTLEINISEFIGDESYIDYLVEKINEAGEDRDVRVNYN